jgi:flagellar biosynthesis protein FlhG
MSDQACKLRALVQSSSPLGDAAGGVLPMIVVTGGRAGVGATTVAINLAAVLADRGARVLLVDAARNNSISNKPGGLRRKTELTLADVVSGNCSIEDAVLPGPAGLRMVLAGGRVASRNRIEASPRRIFDRRDSATWERLLTELQSLDEEIDLVIVDSGSGPMAHAKSLWKRTKLVVLVTTPDDAAVLDTYATLKACAADANDIPLRLLVNRADSDALAADAHGRIDAASQRFLGRCVPALPALPRHRAGDFMLAHRAPRVWEMPNTPFGHAMLWLGRAVSEVVGCQVTTLPEAPVVGRRKDEAGELAVSG